MESLGDALPPAVVVGCVTGRGQPVDTLALPAAEYDDEDLATFERLYDVMHWVSFDAALAGSIDLLRKHAIFAGLSTGGAYLAARWELRREPRGPVLFIGIVPRARRRRGVRPAQTRQPRPPASVGH